MQVLLLAARQGCSNGVLERRSQHASWNNPATLRVAANDYMPKGSQTDECKLLGYLHCALAVETCISWITVAHAFFGFMFGSPLGRLANLEHASLSSSPTQSIRVSVSAKSKGPASS
jgi:hypothetical protein